MRQPATKRQRFMWNSNTTARKHGAPGRLTYRDQLPSGPCAYCGVATVEAWDHIVPLVVGGANRPDNLQPCCLSCNQRKSRRSHEAFVGEPLAVDVSCANCGRTISRRASRLALDRRYGRRKSVCSLRCRGQVHRRLGDEVVGDIRARLHDGESKRSIALFHGISRATVLSIAEGRTWRDAG